MLARHGSSEKTLFLSFFRQMPSVRTAPTHRVSINRLGKAKAALHAPNNPDCDLGTGGYGCGDAPRP
jgi:hypothetical protein